jgi:hypothetical protein
MNAATCGTLAFTSLSCASVSAYLCCREVAGLGLLKLLLNSIGVHGVTGMDTMLAFRCSRDLGYVIKLFTQQVRASVCVCGAFVGLLE